MAETNPGADGNMSDLTSSCHCRVRVGVNGGTISSRLVAVPSVRRIDGDNRAFVDPDCVLCNGSGLINRDDSILVDIHHGSTSESWAVVYRDGYVRHHYENDGAAYLRRPKVKNTKIGLAELHAELRRHSSSDRQRDAETRRQLAEFCDKHGLEAPAGAPA